MRLIGTGGVDRLDLTCDLRLQLRAERGQALLEQWHLLAPGFDVLGRPRFMRGQLAQRLDQLAQRGGIRSVGIGQAIEHWLQDLRVGARVDREAVVKK